MKHIFLIIIILCVTTVCYADRVCLEKSTGKLIEYQSGDAPLGTLANNAVNAGYKKEDIEEKYVTKEEWEIIQEEQIKKPAQEKQKQKELEKQQKREAIKTKLNLTEKDWENLKEALGD